MAEEKGTGSGRYAVALLLGLVRRLPQRLAVALGGLLGRLLWALSWRKVDRGEARCVAALGVGITVARGIVRRSFVNLGRSAVEFVRLDRMMPGLRETVTVEGRENLDRALARGRGALLMAAHIGNWELAGARLVLEGYSVVPLYTPQRNRGGLNDLIQHQRTAVAGMKMVPSEGAGLREAFRTLRRGGIVGFLQDLDARSEGIPVPFLGLPASAADGIVKLHRKFGSPVVPVLYFRRPDGISHTVVIQDILSDALDADGNPFGADMVKSLQMCHNVLEGWVRAYPDQWLWLLDRWESTLG